MNRERRYKERGLQFGSAENSRALRAVESQAGRKARRDALFSRRRNDRVDVSLDCKDSKRFQKATLANVSVAAFPKKSERELAIQRYKDLLRWKEEKKKRMVNEKRKRKPSFKTGLFQPNQPKFLISDDVKFEHSTENTPAKTPFKYLQRSTSKYGITPGTSIRKIPKFCTGVTPSTSSLVEVPKYKLRTTPTASLGRAGILNWRSNAQKENLPDLSNNCQKIDKKSLTRMKSRTTQNVEMKRTLRGRSTRLQDNTLDCEELGVKAFPKTPKVIRQKTKKALPSIEGVSFAPDNFAFTFTKDASHDDPSTENQDVSENEKYEPGDHMELKEEEAVNSSENTPYAIEDKANEGEHNLNEVERIDSVSDEESEKLASICSQAEECSLPGDSENDLSLRLDEVDEVIGTQTNKDTIEIDESNKSKNLDVQMEIDNISEDDHSDMTYEKAATNVSFALKSSVTEKKESPKPVHRRSTRRSVKLTETTLTPMMSRLRPRTPCSRSTRRSLSAHCDYIPDFACTPSLSVSTRRRSRRSANVSLRSMNVKESPIPLTFDEEIKTNVINEASEISESNSNTAINIETVEEISEDQPEESNATQPVFLSPNECSIIASRLDTATPEQGSSKKTAKFDDYVTPSSSRRRGHVSWMVEDSPYVNSLNRSKNRHSGVPQDIIGLFDDIPTDGSPLPAHLTPLLELGRQIQKSISPALPVCEGDSSSSKDENIVPSEDQTCTNLLALLEPTSPPSRTETPDVDVWSEESLGDLANTTTTEAVTVSDTIASDEVADTLAPLGLNTSTAEAPLMRRKSSRISLLPGMSDSPMPTGKLSAVSGDLISWDTPMCTANKVSKVTKERGLPTPVRRSRRLSKACSQ
ncbi:hypothetical protein SK128_001161 [Halocaridina rubra]|uniref:Uncharacterized protein n=1 Tax=Halocaridina rubra TaxID=373956 RepID=A0AAN8WRU6_HALRR